MRAILSDVIVILGFLSVCSCVLFAGRLVGRRIQAYGTRILVELQDLHQEGHGETVSAPEREAEGHGDPAMMQGFENLMRYSVKTAREQK